MTTDRAVQAHITTLLAGAKAGHYTVPDELGEAWTAYEAARGLTIPEPETLAVDTAAARIVMQVAAGETPDLVAVGREMHRLDGERAALGYVQRAVAEAQAQTSAAAVGIVVGLADRIIVEHLRPALSETLADAAKLVPVLAGHGAHPDHDAPEKQHKAAATLGRLAKRRTAIYDARWRVVVLGGRPPKHDTEGMFSQFEHPERLTPDWSTEAGAWPGLSGPIGPQDDVERLWWLVTDPLALAAVATVATVDEADERWWALFGERVDRQNQMNSDARAIAAMFPNRRRDPRVLNMPS